MSVLIVIPTFNEEKNIYSVLEKIETYSKDVEVTVVVVDGLSKDKTRDIVEGYCPQNFVLHLLDNPKRLQAAGVNAAVNAYKGNNRILIRMDAHSVYPDDFLDSVTKPLVEGLCSSVVVSMETLGGNMIQNIQSDVFNCPIGNGGSSHRKKDVISGYADHGHHAAFLLEDFIKVGMYNEALVANEDAEFDRRMVAGGRKILLHGKATIGYIPRETLGGLVSQYFRNGYYRYYSSRIDGSRLSFRQTLPVGVVFACIVAFVSVFCFLYDSDPISLLFAIPFTAYLAVLFVGGWIYMRKESVAKLPVFVLVALAAHLSFGSGLISSFLVNWK